MTFRTKLVCNLTDEEYRRCSALTQKRIGQSGMRAWLRWLRKFEQKPRRARVWLVEQDEQLIGWALTYGTTRREGEVDCTWAHVYVRAKFRRRGIGTRLLRSVLEREPDAVVSPYTYYSRAFYLANGFTELISGTQLRRPRIRS
jgi:GNAT superfamily N-acetyltransferase